MHMFCEHEDRAADLANNSRLISAARAKRNQSKSQLLFLPISLPVETLA